MDRRWLQQVLGIASCTRTYAWSEAFSGWVASGALSGWAIGPRLAWLRQAGGSQVLNFAAT